MLALEPHPRFPIIISVTIVHVNNIVRVDGGSVPEILPEPHCVCVRVQVS